MRICQQRSKTDTKPGAKKLDKPGADKEVFRKYCGVNNLCNRISRNVFPLTLVLRHLRSFRERVQRNLFSNKVA